MTNLFAGAAVAKSIYLTDEQWSQVAAHAVACGFFVGRGQKSQLAKFVVLSAEWAHNNGMKAENATAPAKSQSESNDEELQDHAQV